MEITVWSAGKNGIYAKLHIAIGVMMATIWIILLASFVLGCIVDTNNLLNIRYVIIGILTMILTFIEPLMGLHIIRVSIRAYKRNKLITIKIFTRDSYRSDTSGEYKVVYVDKDGIITCNDIASFEDWKYFKEKISFNKCLKIYEKNT